MFNYQKKFFKIVSASLTAVMLNVALLQTAVFADHHHHQPTRHYQPRYRQVRYYQPRYYQPSYYKSHHHQRYHGTWTKRDTATVAGLAAVIGLLALANRKHRESVAPAEPVTYAEYGNQLSNNAVYADFAVEVLRLVNMERAKVGAAPLQLSGELMAACAIRSEEITRRFAHERPDCSSCFTLLHDRNRWLGENIAAGNSTAAATVNQWMNSPGHRANILNKKYKELGVGHSHKPNSEYGDYWVQMFRG